MLVEDILLGDTNDLIIQGGDLRVDESDQQHVLHILQSDKGQFRQWPLIGFGANRMLNASFSSQRIKNAIKVQLVSDNYTVREIKVTEDFTVSIDAKRKL